MTMSPTTDKSERHRRWVAGYLYIRAKIEARCDLDANPEKPKKDAA